MTPPALAAAVARAPWAALLPAHRLDGEQQPSGAPVCVDALELGPGCWLAVVADASGHLHPVPTVPDDDGDGVRRARPGDGAAEALLDLLPQSPGRRDGFELVSWHRERQEPGAGERGFEVDQTNESVVVGERAVVKWTVRLADSPAPARLAALVAAGFDRLPRPWGLLLWHPPDGSPPLMVASVVAFRAGAVDGWTWAVEDLRADLASGSHRAVATATALGTLVAELHLALGADATPATRLDAERWRREGLDDLARALAVTTGPAHAVLEAHASEARQVLVTVAQREGALMIPVHGDLHVGQVLRGGAPDRPDYLVTDFDGNPVVPPAERHRPQPAALDVAGMAQSLSHVGPVLLRQQPDVDAGRVEALAAATVESFLTSYTAALAAAGAGDLFDPRLQPALRLRQVCREFTYAATHLPRWSYVPEAALPALLAQLDGEAR